MNAEVGVLNKQMHLCHDLMVEQSRLEMELERLGGAGGSEPKCGELNTRLQTVRRALSRLLFAT